MWNGSVEGRNIETIGFFCDLGGSYLSSYLNKSSQILSWKEVFLDYDYLLIQDSIGSAETDDPTSSAKSKRC